MAQASPFNPGDRVVGLYTKTQYLIIGPHPRLRNAVAAKTRHAENYALNPDMIRLWTETDGPWEGPEE